MDKATLVHVAWKSRVFFGARKFLPCSYDPTTWPYSRTIPSTHWHQFHLRYFFLFPSHESIVHSVVLSNRICPQICLLSSIFSLHLCVIQAGIIISSLKSILRKLKIIKLRIWISQLITSCLSGAAHSPEKKIIKTHCNSVVNIIIMAGHYVPCEPELHKSTLMQTQSALQLSQKECGSRQHNTLILH